MPQPWAQSEVDHRMLLELLRLKLAEQPPPKITAKLAKQHHQAVIAARQIITGLTAGALKG